MKKLTFLILAFAAHTAQAASPFTGVYVSAAAGGTLLDLQVDQTISVGMSLGGASWGRRDDNMGVAVIVNGLSKDHMDYLAAGGNGFMLGDGRLTYAPEQIAEIYYQYKPFRTVGIAADFQWVNHPGYNQDRGAAAVFATRMHYEI